MRRTALFALMAALGSAPGGRAFADHSAPVTVVDVTEFGAVGDGRADDRPAIQAAIDALAAKHGGVLRIPKGTYLLDSYRPATHPWGFYNLLVGSGIRIEGRPGATLLQGVNGRAPLPQGATAVMNSVLVVGTPLYSVVTCQSPDHNGGFYPLLATVADTDQAKLTNAADAARFAAGDYAAIYASTTGDVIPTELTRITAVTAEGRLTLASPLARSFSAPVVANVTRLVTSDVSLRDLTVQGAVPLTVMETYGFSAEDCRLLADTNVGGANAVTVLNCNTMRSFRFVGNELGSVGPGHVGIELPQRNSQDGLFEKNTMRVTSLGFGEYGAHWRFLGNHLWLYPSPQTAAAISITGLDVLFSGNDVHCEELSGGEGWGSVLTDFYAPGGYAPYIGRNRIADNAFDCKLVNAYCLRLGSRDPVVSGNRIRCTGPGTAIRSDGVDVAATILDNDISVDTGAGIMLEGGGNDASVVSRNRLAATNGSMAVHVASPPNTDKQRVDHNTVSGFARDVVRESPVDSAAKGGAPPTIAATTPTVTSRPVAVGGRRYTVYDAADPATKSFCVVIPEGLRKVRGLLVNCNYAGGDSRDDWTFCHYYREFMHLHDFALVASTGDIPHVKAFKALRDCLQRVSVAAKHPELVNAPYAAVGFSAGGGFASTLLTHDPEKTIAVGILGARFNFDVFARPGGPTGPTAVHLGIPSILITGETERLNDPAADSRHRVDEVFVPCRPRGAEYAWLERQGIGHEYDGNRQDLLVMPLLDLAVRTRYPKDGDVTKGPIELIPIDPATGWIADNTTWKSGLTKIAPAKEFQGDLGHSSWLQNEDLAFIYRAYSTYDKPLVITSPARCGPGTPALDPGSFAPITVDASKLANWRTMAFYDGARKLAEIAQGPTTFTATNLTPGYHVFSVLATDDRGTVRTADPMMVVVRPPP